MTVLEDAKVSRFEGMLLPVIIQPLTLGTSLSQWIACHRSEVLAEVQKSGAILFRGFDVGTQESFGQAVDAFSSRRVDYVYRSTPRTHLGDRIFTASEYSPTANIPLHNENSFQREWPLYIWFYCQTVAPVGGLTPIADCFRVTGRIPEAIREKFDNRQLMYTRNYREGLDVAWQTVFQTKEPRIVEKYCREHEISYEWLPAGGLRTRQVCHATVCHPVRRETVWFNQAHLFHYSALEEDTRKALFELYKPHELPRHVSYGDGQEIEGFALELIRKAYRLETVKFNWEQGDALLADNMAVAHGRTSFEGKRTVLVAMSDATHVGKRDNFW